MDGVAYDALFSIFRITYKHCKVNTIELQIACNALRSEIPKDGTLEERLAAAMTTAKDKKSDHNIFWMSAILNDDMRFLAAIGAVMIDATPEENERITKSLTQLKVLNSMMKGIPVDFDSIDMDGVIPLMGMFQDAGKAPEAHSLLNA